MRPVLQGWLELANGEGVRRDDAHATAAGGDEDEFGAATDDAEPESRSSCESVIAASRGYGIVIHPPPSGVSPVQAQAYIEMTMFQP